MADKVNKANKIEKVPLKILISNVIYVFRYALKIDSKTIITKFLSEIFVTVGNALISTLLIKMVIDALMAGKSFSEIMIAFSFGIAFILTVNIFRIFSENYFEAKFNFLSGKVQRIFIKKASEIDLLCYDTPKYFDDFVIAASQSDQMLGLCISSLSIAISFCLAILTVGGIIFTINPIIAIFPIVGFVVNIVTRFKIIKTEYEMEIERKAVARKTDYSKRVFYQPEYLKEIKLSDISTPLHRQLDESIEELCEVAKKYGVKIAIYSLINWITVFTFLSFFCLPAYLGYLALVTKKIALGDVASMNTAANSVRGYLDALNYTLANIQKVGLYADRFRRFVEYEVLIENTKGTVKLPENLSNIEIKNMSFKYDGNDEYALKNINITIMPQEKIALVGHNGAGKTTFVKLLMRLYDVTDGEISYGGTNIKNFPIKEYRDSVGVVFQDFQLFAASISENVLMNFANESNYNTVKTALEKGDFTSRLDKLSNGMETQLTREFSEEGVSLSGGEAQKIAISRMFAKKLKIAILDEPSSALDPIAEFNLNNSMLQHASDASIIFISHRLSTTRFADKIYMFENGEIIEQGTHEELIMLEGSYAKMFQKQAHYYQKECLSV